jgi:hypothetical protein
MKSGLLFLELHVSNQLLYEHHYGVQEIFTTIELSGQP